MKIDSYRQSFIAETGAAPAAGGPGRPAARGPQAAGRDEVRVSADAQLLSAALTAAAPETGIRADVVEAMKAKLAAGEIGDDPLRLADRMIDGLLEP